MKSGSRRKNKLVILCSPHNPGGRVWTKEELKISEIAVKYDLIVVSDEIHADLTFNHKSIIYYLQLVKKLRHVVLFVPQLQKL